MWGLIIFADDIDTFVFEDDKNATFSVAVDGWCDTGVCTKTTGGCRCGDNDSCGWRQCDQQRWKLYDRLLRLFQRVRQLQDAFFLACELRESFGKSQRGTRYSLLNLQVVEYQGSCRLRTWAAPRTSRCLEEAVGSR